MKKLRGINLAIAILSSILLVFVGAVLIQISSDKIVKNTYIKDINVGGLTKEEAIEKMKNEYKVKNITFIYKEKSWVVNPSEIETSYDLSQTVESAFNINRNHNFINNIMVTIKSYLGIENELVLEINYNEGLLTEKLDEISEDINVEMINASIDVSSGQVFVNEEKPGLQVDIETSVKHFKKSLQQGIFEEALTVTKVEPEVKKEDLQSVDTLLGSFSTRLIDISPGRIENIKIATERTSGVLLMPGEEFSYNNHTGMRTTKNGYKNATVIVSGEAVQGVGGGVCQVSTTLYNTVLYSGLDIVKVSNHSIPSSYVNKGRDAVVSDSGLDFIFKNNYDVPVYVKNYYNNGVITCQIYGNSNDKKDIKIVTGTDKVGNMSIKKENDLSLKLGTEKIIERGRNSYSVSTYRVYYDKNGSEIKREKVANSYYPGKQQVIAIGTKKEEEKPNEEIIKQEDNIGQENNNGNNDSNGNDGSTENGNTNEEVIN